jgi:hypothetical protein
MLEQLGQQLGPPAATLSSHSPSWCGWALSSSMSGGVFTCAT